MQGRRLRSILEPVLYVGIAALVHSALFLIPGGSPPKKEGSTTQRGVRVRAFVERPPAAGSSATAPAPPPKTAMQSPPPARTASPALPLDTREKNYSVPGNRNANGESAVATGQVGGARGAGSSPAESGGGGTPAPTAASRAQEGSPPQTEFGKYLASIKSKNVQGWAKESALKSQQGWKGTGGSGSSGTGGGWGSGSGSGGGAGSASAGGSGKGKSGTGTGVDGAAFMDPRVKLVVTSYPPTGIERSHGQIPYPNLKIKQSKFTSGWWNVYIKVRIDAEGKPVNMEVLRPETDGPLERQFLDQVRKEVRKWSFEPKEAEIHVDVRFYVE